MNQDFANFSPLIAALIAATFAFFGWRLIEDHVFSRSYALARRNNAIENIGSKIGIEDSDMLESSKSNILPLQKQIQILRKTNALNLREAISMFLAFVSAFGLSFALTSSKEISASIAILGTSIPFILVKKKAKSLLRLKERAWPEAIDNIISALLAGNSIVEAVSSLGNAGPLPLRATFRRIAEKINQGISFEVALVEETGVLQSATADQTLSSLLLAKEFGGRDVTNTLRLLSTFLREQDESIEEIETKFGWVRNSALLGAAAPWLLLALLSTQQNTVDAYQTSAGKAVLSFGVIATAVAYLLMERIARAPNPPRVQLLLKEGSLG